MEESYFQWHEAEYISLCFWHCIVLFENLLLFVHCIIFFQESIIFWYYHDCISEGCYCEYISSENADNFPTFAEYQETLTKECDCDQGGMFTWTPDENTPDLVYYQVKWQIINAPNQTSNILINILVLSQCYLYYLSRQNILCCL